MADELRVTNSVRIPRSELVERFAPSGGPGGQHANKASTRVELRWHAATSTALGQTQRDRVVARLGPVVRVVVDQTRSQARNRALAEEQLVARVAGALAVERPRRPTRPGRGATERRLQAKRSRSDTKANRRRPDPEG